MTNPPKRLAPASNALTAVKPLFRPHVDSAVSRFDASSIDSPLHGMRHGEMRL